MRIGKRQTPLTFDSLVALYVLLDFDGVLPASSFQAAPPSTFPAQAFMYRLKVEGIIYRLAFVDGDWPSILPLIIYDDGSIILFLNHEKKGGYLFKSSDGWFLLKAFILLAVAHKRTKSKEDRKEFFCRNTNVVSEENPLLTIEDLEVEMKVLQELDWPLPIDRQRVLRSRQNDWMGK